MEKLSNHWKLKRKENISIDLVWRIDSTKFPHEEGKEWNEKVPESETSTTITNKRLGHGHSSSQYKQWACA